MEKIIHTKLNEIILFIGNTNAQTLLRLDYYNYSPAPNHFEMIKYNNL